VLSTEINSFFLLFLFLIWAAIITILAKVAPASWIGADGLLVNGGYVFVGIFIFRAFRLFYNEKWWVALIKTIIFMFLHLLITIYLYKFILFVAVMLTI
jgi:hypothetical protein